MTAPDCKQCTSSFEITDGDLKFYDKVSPILDGKKYPLPPPTLCPECRQQRRLAICNEFNLYPGVCKMCNSSVITEIEPGSPYTIYCRECFMSDKFDPTSYGQDFDFARPFFEQFEELTKAVPFQNLQVDGTLVNCEYIHYAGWSKNSYLIMHADFCENCYYGYGFKKNLYCVDGFYNLHSELCYDCVDVHKSYGLTGCQDCISCNSSAFLRDCIGCRNCLLCVGLRQKEYCIRNKQYSRENYEKELQKIDLGSYSQYQKLKKERPEIERDHTFKEFQGNHLENSFGNYLYNCKNVSNSFDCEDVEDGKYCYQLVLGAKDVYDTNQYGTKLEMTYESCIVGDHSYHLLFSFNCHTNCANLFYCWEAITSKDCFGCISLKNDRYCILNKQYSKEEYEEMVPRIIEHMKKTGEWGEFPPMRVSKFGYNKTTAHLYYPLEKGAAVERGLKWMDTDPPPPKVSKTISADKLPDNIKDIPDLILDWAIECEVTGKPFRITEPELKFYRQQKLPIPRRYFYQRHLDRFRLRNPRKFWERGCGKCGETIRTTYAPERPEAVYCEKCYLATVY